jgi:hypothetical protein
MEEGMSLFFRVLSASAALLFLGSTAALAQCNVGDIQCSRGYRYVCKCWTSTGCRYEPDSGSCHNDDSTAPLSAVRFRLLTNSHNLQAQLVCRKTSATGSAELCAVN